MFRSSTVVLSLCIVFLAVSALRAEEVVTEPRLTFTGHTGFVYSVAFSPDGTKVLTGSTDKMTKLWDASTGGCISTFVGHVNPVRSVAFSPDGMDVLAGGWGERAKLWSLSASAPDLLIRADGEVDSEFGIDDVYHVDPSGNQIESMDVQAGGAAVFQIRVQNDDDYARWLFVRAVENTETGWRLACWVGNVSITSNITGPDGYTTPILAPGESETIRMELHCPGGAPVGSTKSVRINVFGNEYDDIVRDSVEAIAMKAQPPIPADVNGDGCVNVADLLLVRSYLGMGSGCR